MKEITDQTLTFSADYRQFIEDLKSRVTAARLSAARRINHELFLLYWDIGRAIVEKRQTLGWGDSVVEMIAADLQKAFPTTKGFSPQNVWLMLQFHQAHTDEAFLSQVRHDLKQSGKTISDRKKLSQLVREMAKQPQNNWL